MTEFDEIYLIWRLGAGSRRQKVGIIKRNDGDKVTFQYFPEAEILKDNKDFRPYTEFQDMHKVYTENVVEIFAQRLTKLDRPDIQSFFKFWEIDIDKAQDKFYLLGKTQGLVATDNFEFIAQYKLLPNTHFVTEIAGLSKSKISSEILAEGDSLTFKKDTRNKFDNNAIEVFKGSTSIGYIKKFQTEIFHQPGADKLKLTVKAIEKNGYLKRVFIKVNN